MSTNASLKRSTSCKMPPTKNKPFTVANVMGVRGRAGFLLASPPVPPDKSHPSVLTVQIVDF